MMMIIVSLNCYFSRRFLGTDIYIKQKDIMKNILAENMRRFGTKNLHVESSSSPNQNQQKYNNKGLAQKAYDRLYDLTSEFGGDYPLSYLDDNLPQELNHTLDKFFDDNDYLTSEEDKQLAKALLEIVKELKDELKYG